MSFKMPTIIPSSRKVSKPVRSNYPNSDALRKALLLQHKTIFNIYQKNKGLRAGKIVKKPHNIVTREEDERKDVAIIKTLQNSSEKRQKVLEVNGVLNLRSKQKNIVEQSHSSTWKEAKSEWVVMNMYLGVNNRCVCASGLRSSSEGEGNYLLNNIITKNKMVLCSSCIKCFKLMNISNLHGKYPTILSRKTSVLSLVSAMESLSDLQKSVYYKANEDLVSLAEKCNIFTKSDGLWYMSPRPSLSSDFRVSKNRLLLRGFSYNAHTCCSGTKIMVPRLGKNRTKYYYICPSTDHRDKTKGCGSLEWTYE